MPSANFDYSGPLTETILLGGIASHFPGESLQWNAEKLQFTGHADATALVKREYREGWSVPGLGLSQKKAPISRCLKKIIRLEPVDLPFRVVALAYLTKEQNLY